MAVLRWPKGMSITVSSELVLGFYPTRRVVNSIYCFKILSLSPSICWCVWYSSINQRLYPWTRYKFMTSTDYPELWCISMIQVAGLFDIRVAVPNITANGLRRAPTGHPRIHSLVFNSPQWLMSICSWCDFIATPKFIPWLTIEISRSPRTFGLCSHSIKRERDGHF